MKTRSAPSVLQARHLRFGWPDRVLLKDLSFDLPTGLSLVTGGDGCGKSSLLRLLAGDLQAEAGTLSIGGSTAKPGDAAWRQQVFWADPEADPHATLCVSDHLQQLYRRYPNSRGDALAELVDGFALAPHLGKPLHMLSTGSRRKVALTAAFAAGAPLTLIDQPFAALDGPAVRFLRELLQDVASHPRRAWLIADHQPPDGVPLALTLTLDESGTDA